MPTKEQIQHDIESKTKELNDLKSRILQEAEHIKKDVLEQQRKQIEQDIQTLQKQLDQQKDIEVSTTSGTTNKEAKQLKDVIETDSDRTYELIKGTKMHEKLITVLGSEAKIETFALDIDRVVRKYLDQEISGFPNTIKNSMSVGIQFAMIETLISQGAQGSSNFFESFSTFQSSPSTTKSFEGLYKIFGRLGNANQFYLLANKVQNLTRYLSDHTDIITKTTDIPELVDPNAFRRLLNMPIWSDVVQMKNLDISKILTLHPSSSVDIHVGEAELKKIIDNEKISSVISDSTISSIQKSLVTADKLLDTRSTVKDKATTIIDKVSGFLDINIPFLGNLGELFGMKFPTDFLDRKKDGGIINFILGVLGFQGGIKGLHTSYIKEQLAASDIDDPFISDSYASYLQHTDTTIPHDSPYSVRKMCSLSAPDSASETLMKSKLPTDYTALKKSVVDHIQDAKLNPLIVAKFAPQTISDQQGKQIVDMAKVSADKDSFVDAYLRFIIPTLADTREDFISSSHVDKDSFLIALLGSLSGDKYFIEGVNIGLITSSKYALPQNPLSPSPSPEVAAGLGIANAKIDISKGNFSPEQTKNINLLIDTMDSSGIKDPTVQIGLLSVISKESGFIPQNEISYKNTPNTTIRSIFGDRVPTSDAALNILKNDDKAFFDAVYGPAASSKLSWDTGNINPGDGYLYRGRGFNQLTFKNNYKKYGDIIGVDLVKNPDLLNTPEVAAKVALAFFTKGVEYPTLPTFADKQQAAAYFANLNNGGKDGAYRSSVIQTAEAFDIQGAVA